MFGSLRKLYRNTLFRLSLLGALLFVLSLFAALGYVYYAVVESELRRCLVILRPFKATDLGDGSWMLAQGRSLLHG